MKQTVAAIICMLFKHKLKHDRTFTNGGYFLVRWYDCTRCKKTVITEQWRDAQEEQVATFDKMDSNQQSTWHWD